MLRKQERMEKGEKERLEQYTRVCIFNRQLRFPGQRSNHGSPHIPKERGQGAEGAGEAASSDQAPNPTFESSHLFLTPTPICITLCSSCQCSTPGTRKITVLSFSNYVIVNKSFHVFRF